MRLEAVLALFGDLDVVELTGWVARGWVRPDPAGEDWEFHAIDIARVHLIHDLRRGMDVSEDAVGLVLSLLDQVYDLRAELQRVAAALEGQPEDVRAAIIAALRGT